MTRRNWASVIAVVWFILALPKPAQPYGIAFVGAVIVWAFWKTRREMKSGKIDQHDGVDCRCAWCVEQEKEEELDDAR
jgi:hypothetical protein